MITFSPSPQKSLRRVLTDALQRICDRINPNYDYWIQRRCRAAYIEVNAKQVVLAWLDKPVDREAFELKMKLLEFYVMNDIIEGLDSLDKLNTKVEETMRRNWALEEKIQELKRLPK